MEAVLITIASVVAVAAIGLYMRPTRSQWVARRRPLVGDTARPATVLRRRYRRPVRRRQEPATQGVTPIHAAIADELHPPIQSLGGEHAGGAL